MKKKYVVYELWNPMKNEPFYVGKGSRKSKRWYHHRQMATSGREKSHKAHTIKKIISEGFDVKYKIVFETDCESEAFKKEKELIKTYGRRDVDTGILTNLTDGGEGVSGWKVTDEFREMCKKRFSGRNNPMYGKHHSKKVKDFISNLNSGNKNGFFGRHHSHEHKQKLKVDNPGARVRSIPICQFNTDGELIKVWPSLKGAARTLSTNDDEFESFCRKIRIRVKKNKWDTFLDCFWREKSEYDKSGFVFCTKTKKYSIVQKKIDGEIVNRWTSLKEVERSLGADYNVLWKCMKAHKPYLGFMWEKY